MTIKIESANKQNYQSIVECLKKAFDEDPLYFNYIIIYYINYHKKYL